VLLPQRDEPPRRLSVRRMPRRLTLPLIVTVLPDFGPFWNSNCTVCMPRDGSMPYGPYPCMPARRCVVHDPH
jgi:hypothetical protein